MVFGLSACASGGGAGGGDAKTAAVGNWELAEMTGADVPEGGVAALKEMGMTITLEMGADGTFTMDLMGDKQSGTWEAKDGGTIAMTADGVTVDAKLEGGKLSLTQEGMGLVFSKK